MVSIPATAADVRPLTIDDIELLHESAEESQVWDVAGYCFRIGSSEVFRPCSENLVLSRTGAARPVISTQHGFGLKGKRLDVAFAFKGPGLKTKLVLGKIGMNGDQLPRLFQEEVDVFIVQHWREVDPLVIRTMRDLAIANSVTSGRRLFYGVVDGSNSNRLYLAYPAQFSAKARRKSSGN